MALLCDETGTEHGLLIADLRILAELGMVRKIGDKPGRISTAAGSCPLNGCNVSTYEQWAIISPWTWLDIAPLLWDN
jgi:hypothetical protein